MCETGKEGVNMTGDQAVELINEQKKRGLNLSFDFFIFDEYNEIRDGTPRGVASRNLFN